ncbi:MAG: aerobic carbon-monoxide dehydrogenase large subunit, partial [Acidimicrobiaceae bacterium]
MSILGTRVARKEDPRFLTAGGTYMADFRDPLLDGALYVTFVRSTLAHGTFTVDVGEAAAAPGVRGVFTHADLDIGPMPLAIFMLNPLMVRPVLADGRVRFVGEPIAAIVSDRPEQGADAAELVIVDYEPLPVVVDPEDSVRNEVLLFEEAGTNSAFELMVGHSDDLFEGCEVVVKQRVMNPRVNAAPLEVRGAAAAWDPNGKLNLWLSTQGAHGVRDAIATLFGLEKDGLRVATPDVGGGFGAKTGAAAEDVFVAWAARRLGQPVRWHETRSENMVGMVHGRGQIQTVEIGGSRDGKVGAYRLTVLQDAGAYPAIGAILPFLTRIMAPGVYVIPKVECNSNSVATNTTPTGAYRGAGRPEAAAAIERAMDLYAAEIGMDAVEVRRRNLMPKFDTPTTTAVDTSYDNGDYETALDLALSSVGYDGLRAEQ